MKYRILSDIELKELENDFKHFLIANSVYDDEWKKLNQNNDKRVIELIEKFSDIVVEKALANVKFLEFIAKDSISTFFCAKNEMILIGIECKRKEIDFTKQPFDLIKGDLIIYKTVKPYKKKREEEIFELLESGCSLIQEEQFKRMDMAYNLSQQSTQN